MKVGTTIVSAFDPPAATDGKPDCAARARVQESERFSRHGRARSSSSIRTSSKSSIAAIDDAWDEDAFERMSAHGVGGPMDPAEYLLFPTGPFIGEIADTIVNFTTERKIEDAQP